MSLPLAIALAVTSLAIGLAVGRYYVADDKNQKRAARNGRSYMRAVLFLLSRDRDAAVEELKSVVREGVSDIEPYFALGALFRARGEWERAIRVHQAIELRERDSPRMARRARFELGLDFRAADMPRRAIQAMEGCLTEEPSHEGALRALCGLYEDAQRYAEAALAWRRLDALGDGSPVREQHLWAAAAAVAVVDGDVELAKRAVREMQTDQTSDASVRSHSAFAESEVLASRSDFSGARRVLLELLKTDPALATLVVKQLKALHLREGEPSELGPAKNAVQNTLDDLSLVIDEAGDNSHVLLARAELLMSVDDKAANADFRQVASVDPELLPARVWAARSALASGEHQAIVQELAALAGEGGALAWVMAAVWRCGYCGRREDEHFWRCDACHRWGTARRDVGMAAYDRPSDPPRERRSRLRKRRSPLMGEVPPRQGEESVIDKAGTFISGVWRTVRGGENPPSSGDGAL